ncbi:MAG: fumarylacetoacetate hydrolase family protein [Lachnospiraceae bacterium]|nr:fumarylacetoacetate hydrolase family protein [Lachnospiraceae bacterium]
MRLYTIEINGKETVAAEGKDGSMYPLDSFGVHVRDMNELIGVWERKKERIEAGLREASGVAVRQGDFKILAPVPVPMQDIVCLGVNYREHIEETADVLDFTKKTDTVYFSKRVNRCTAPGGLIPFYDFVDSLDYEVELGVILKRDAYRVKASEAEKYIFGYTIINDVSARNIQLKHQQWYLGKSLDGYTPMGPCIVTADELFDVHALAISCTVNGEIRQKSNTKYLITSVEEVIEELTEGMTLKAGTIIATGTPGGVAMRMKPPMFLKPGDVVGCEITGIGRLENTVG